MKENIKKLFFRKDNKIQNLINQLENSKSMAKKYLRIVENLEKNKQIADEDYNYILSNSGILQLKMMKLRPQLGIVHYTNPSNSGEFPKFELIANFPNILKNSRSKDEIIPLIPLIQGILSTYINMLDDIIKDNQKLKVLLNRNKTNKSKWKIIKEDRKTLYNIFLVPVYLFSLSLLFFPSTLVYGVIINIISVFLILLVSFLSKSDSRNINKI